MKEEKSVRAAELALGLLDGAERQEALHEVTADPEMREAYRIWNERLATLCDGPDGPDAVPGDNVFAGIENALFADAAAAGVNNGWLQSLWDLIRAPENRGLVLAVAAAKTMLLAWIVYLFL